MMRGVSTWAVAVRKPVPEDGNGAGPHLGEIEVTSEPLVSWAKRHRLLRLPVIRGVVALGESLKIGFRALAISANAQLESRRTRSPRTDRRLHLGADDRPLAGARDRALLRHPGRRDEPDQGRARLVAAVLAGRGRAADGDLHRLHRRDQPPARPAAGVRVPRRRAQDDLLLRGRRPADPRARRDLLAPAPALRHQLPADRDGARDLRLRPDRPARVVLAARLADPRHPADRRPLLRGDQVGGQATAASAGCGR